MVAPAAYAPPPPPSDSLVAQPPRDFVDTDYAARLDRSTGAICITAPPSGIMAVGGYRFLSQDLQEWARRLGQGALLTALARPAQRPPPRRTRPGQRPRPRGAQRTRA